MGDVRRPHFLLGYDPSMCLERLNIPRDFVKHLEGSKSGTSILVGPSGNNWSVELTGIGDGLFFSDGWEAFVQDHILEQGDSLVFGYDGDLHFTVLIFDQSMCEKEAALSAENKRGTRINGGGNLVKKRDRDVSALLDSIVEGVPKRLRCSEISSEGTHKIHLNSTNLSDDNGGRQEADENNLNNVVTVAVPLAAVHIDNSDPFFGDRNSKLDMRLSPLEAERIAQSYASSFPNFVKVMKRFNISGSYTLNIPYQFAMEHLPNCKLKIVLHNLKGESWTVNSIPNTKVQTSHTFCGGWLSFVRDNDIDIGDVCIFELVRKFELRVRIIRVRKEGSSRHDSEAAPDGSIYGFTSSPKTFRRKLKNINKPSYNEGSVFGSQPRTCLLESEICNTLGSLDKKGSHTKGCVSMKSAPEEKLAAKYFVSVFPHFVRVMKKFNISGSYTLKIPYQFSADHLPKLKTKIVLRNLNGQCWTVNSIPTTKVQTLHTLCGGWMAFVRDNNLQVGDICIFELIGVCEMRVHICGIGKRGLNYPNGTKNRAKPSNVGES